jgi:deoxyribose-phosphate aldolase
MYIDFAFINTDTNEATVKEDIKQILSLNCVNSITLPYYLIRSAKALLLDYKNVDLSCLIDYPLGISDLKTRVFAIDQAIKMGANTIDIVTNRKYDKIREDVKNCIDLSIENNVKIRYILEYRMFDHSCLKKLCEIFENHNMRCVLPSSGYFLDNLADNILASVFLHQNSKDLNIICTGNIWLDKHFDTIKKSGLFGLRTTSIHSLANFVKFNLSHPKE